MRYQVIVGNIGTVLDTDSRPLAMKTYGQYRRDSEEQHGRASGESVVLFDGEDILFEYQPPALENSFDE